MTLRLVGFKNRKQKQNKPNHQKRKVKKKKSTHAHTGRSTARRHQLALTALMSLTRFWARQMPKICEHTAQTQRLGLGSVSYSGVTTRGQRFINLRYRDFYFGSFSADLHRLLCSCIQWLLYQVNPISGAHCCYKVLAPFSLCL